MRRRGVNLIVYLLCMAMTSSACSPALTASAEEGNGQNVQRDWEDGFYQGESNSVSQGDETLDGTPDNETCESVSSSDLFRQRNMSEQTSYYVDSAEGNDENDGFTPQAPWKSLDKINNTTFAPGDKIYLKAGSIWHGQLWPKGSGSAEAPIILDSYGEGEKPLIAGTGIMIKGEDQYYYKGAAVVLHNQDYWEINNLEITNIGPETSTGPDADVSLVQNIRRIGVVISTSSPGDQKETYQHIYLKNLNIHDITGSQDRNNGGILFVNQSGANRTNFEDILVEGCTISNIIGNGITTTSDYIQQYMGTPETGGNPTRWGEFPGKTTVDWGSHPQFKSRDIKIRNNNISNVWCDAILTINVDRPVIEYNVCSNNCYAVGAYAAIWPHSSNDALMQFNEVYDTRYVEGDGQAFDVDYNCDDAVLQYNYSHDNEGGFLLLMESANSPVVRYNISQNDGTKGTGRGLLDICAGNVSVYNNTFYSDVPVFSTRVEGGFAGNGVIANNIFYAKEKVNVSAWKTTAKASYTYQNNAVYQYTSQPEDRGLVTADPRLSAPGTAAFGLDSTAGYRLVPDSACIDAGIQIQDNGGRDYFGNSVIDGLTDIGAHEAVIKDTDQDRPVKVKSILLSTENGRLTLDSKNPSLQLYPQIQPFEADNHEVDWSVESTDGGETSLAAISDSGLLTGLENGTVRVTATAKDGSGAFGCIDIKLEMTATNANQIVDDMNIDDFSKMYEHSGELWMDKNGGDYFGDHARLIRSNKYDTSYIRYATYHYERISGFKITSYYQNYAGTQELPIEDIQFYVSPDGENWREVTGSEYTAEDKLLPRGEEGGSLWTKRIYSCDSLEGGDNFFKVTFPQQYDENKYYDPNIGQIVLNLAAEVESLEISAQNDEITLPGGTLQMSARAMPENIPYQSVVWSVTEPDGTGTEKAVIGTDGMLKAFNNGAVLVKAVSKLDASVFAVKEITLSGQTANIMDSYKDFSKIYEHQGLQLEHVGWFDGGTDTIHPYGDSTGKMDRYMVYRYTDIKGFTTSTYFLDGVQRSLKFFTSLDGETYSEIADPAYENVTRGGASGRQYRVDNLPQETNYLKIQFEDGFSWESNITDTRLFLKDMTGTVLTVESDTDKIEELNGQIRMRVTPSADVYWKVTDEFGLPAECASISADGILSGKSKGVVKVWAVAKADQSITGSKIITIDTKMYHEIFDDLRYGEGYETGNADNLLNKATDHSGGYWHQKNPAGMEAYGIYVNQWMSPSFVTYKCNNIRKFEVQTLCRWDYVNGAEFTFKVSKDNDNWVTVDGVEKTNTAGGYQVVTYSMEDFTEDYHYLRIEFPPAAETARADINLCSVKMVSEIRVESITVDTENELVQGEDGYYVVPKIGDAIQFRADTGMSPVPGLIRWSVENVEESSLTGAFGDSAPNAGDTARNASGIRASITKDGLFTALDYGKVAVHAVATDGSDVSRTIYVKVAVVRPESIVLNKSNKVMETGETLSLKYRISPVNTSNKEVEYSSSAPEVASVDTQTGIVTALRKGEAVITAATVDGGITAACAVSVSDAKDYLSELLLQAESLQEDTYLWETWVTFDLAFRNGKKVLSDPYAYTKIWQQAGEGLKLAMDGLVDKDEAAAKLKALIKRASALDFSKYTQESFTRVQTALTLAMTVVEAGSKAAGTEIRQAEDALQLALDGLQEKEAQEPEADQPGGDNPGEGNQGGDNPGGGDTPEGNNPGENPPLQENGNMSGGKDASQVNPLTDNSRKSPKTGDNSDYRLSNFPQAGEETAKMQQENVPRAVSAASQKPPLQIVCIFLFAVIGIAGTAITVWKRKKAED